MDSMTMVERVAMAILNSDRRAAGLPEAASRVNIPDSDGYVRNARAALEALMEPTPWMIGAGQEVTLNDPDWRAPYTGEVFSAMIQAALDEEGR